MDQRHHSSSSHHLVEAMQSTSIDTLSPPLFAGSSLDPSVALPCAADTSRSSAFEQHLLSLVRSIQGEGSLSPTGSQKSISQLTNSSTNGGRTVIPIDSGVADLEVKTNYEMGVFPFYPGPEKTHTQAQIELAVVDLLGQLRRKDGEIAHLRHAGGTFRPGNGTDTASLEQVAASIPGGFPDAVESSKPTPSSSNSTSADPLSTCTSSPFICPTCSQPSRRLSDQSDPDIEAVFSASNNGRSHTTALLPESTLSRLTPSSVAATRVTSMSAEKELELLKAQVRDIARVCRAVAMGDLENKITVPVEGPIMGELKEVINGMVDQLKSFAGEVERVATEVGTEGRLGGQAIVEGVQGTWRDLTSVVNKLAANLTSQVRAISEVTTAISKGDLSRTIEVQAEGELLELKLTINNMVKMLRNLADEVSIVSLEVGSQGKLGRTADVPHVQGVWSELVLNVNRE